MNEKKKAVVINCFPSDYYLRTKPIIEILEEMNFDVVSFTSTFDHYKKTDIPLDNGQRQIKTIRYKKNVSLRRMISHMKFSFDCYKQLSRMNPELIYVNIPPNTLLYAAARYKKKRHAKLICDICDLWPESMIVSNNLVKKIIHPAMLVWRQMRNGYLNACDLIILECDFFREKLKDHLKNSEFFIAYMSQNALQVEYKNSNYGKPLNLLYIGTINSLVDIELTEKVIKELKKKNEVRVHIVGNGDKKDEYIRRISQAGADTIAYGIVFEEEEKKKIYGKCDWGLNLVKPELSIGLTTKSVDYLSGGLPIINSVGYDTKNMISKYQAGINVNESILETVFSEIGDYSNYQLYRKGAQKAFEENFSNKIFYKLCKEKIEGLQ